MVVGMSVDPAARLAKFKEKYGLRFLLASDADRSVGMAYGTLKGGLESSHERDTVIISREGTIVRAYRRVSARGHAAAVLADAKSLRGEGRL